jgi:uncharacterized repeat protein (TIGR01451 family)/LPXTG-motif cell wall-anchored protein
MYSTSGRSAMGWRAMRVALVVALVAMTTIVVSLVVPSQLSQVSADAADASIQTFGVSPASTALAPKDPGQTFTYTLGMSCESVLAASCDGAVVDIPLPTFTDTFGGISQLVQSGTIIATSSLWSTQPVFTGTAPNVRVTGTLGPGALSGSTFSLSFSATTPIGRFPVGTTTLTATPSLNATPQTGLAVSSYVAATAPNWVIQKTGPSTLLLGTNGTYTVRACPSPTTASFPASFFFSDLLPPGATFVSASNGGTAPANAIADGTTDVVTWTFDSSNRPWPMAGNCVSVTAVVKYVEDPAVSNLTNVDKTNTATGTFDSSSLGTASVTTGLRGPITTIGLAKSVGVGGYYFTNGDPIRFDLGFSNTSEVGAVDLDSAVMTDDLSGIVGVNLTTVDTGSWPGAVSAAVETTTDGSTWLPVAGSPFNGTSQNVALPGSITGIRWRFTGPMPLGFATTGIRLNGSIVGSGNPPTVQQNCVSATGLRSGTTFTATQRCASIRIELPQPDPLITKQITSVVAPDSTAHTASTVAPGDVISYRIQVGNSADATGTLDDPYVTDCAAITAFLRDPVVTVASGWVQDLAYTDASCTSQGGTPIKLTYVGAPIAAGATVTAATYTVYATQFGDAEGVSAAGDYPNTATVTKTTGAFEHGTLSATAIARVPAFVHLVSSKTVLGALDEAAASGPGPDGSNVAGRTTPGGRMTWYLTIGNRGNVAAKDPVYIDIFPRVGDTGVKRIDQQRNSQWAPILVSPIVVPTGWTVQYSTSANPCRQEVGPSPSNPANWPPGCQAPNWSTDTSLFALSTYKSVRVARAGSVAIGASGLTFKWEMRAPAYDSSYDAGGVSSTDPYEALVGCNTDPPSMTQDPTVTSPCPRAINSFAWSAEADPSGVPAELNPGRISSEPTRSGIQVTALPQGNGIGDRVWNDTDYDGMQDGGENGVPGVYVELFKWDSLLSQWDLYGFTYTDPSGTYRFDNEATSGALGLPNGQYKVRFYPPSIWNVSPQDRDGLGSSDLDTPGNGNTDSDLPRTPTGTGSSGAVTGIDYYETTSVDLDDTVQDERDASWDLGLWTPAPALTIDTVTKDSAWADGSAGDGVTILQGRPVTWIYTVTNTGNTRLQNVAVSDNNGTTGTTGDDFNVTSCTLIGNGTNADGLNSSATAPIALNRGASMVCTATGVAGASTYTNRGTVVGAPRFDDGTLITNGSPPATVTANDPSSHLVGRYDLALTKTVGAPDFATGNVVFSIIVRNQGTVASGTYDITDALPGIGLSYVSSSVTPTTVNSSALVWSAQPSLAAGATAAAITVTMRIDDWTKRPWRNLAEISADSSAAVQTGGVSTPTQDVDSTPDANAANDMPNPKTYGPVGSPTAGGADNTSVTEAGTGTDGEDDADIADLATAPTYDLALAVVADATGVVANGDGAIAYTITVQNQGNVDSGTYTVTNTVPAGLTATTPVPGGGVVSAGPPTTITWTGTNLTPGSMATFSFTASISDVNARNFRNIAEVSADAAQSRYAVDDVDSTPDAITSNDMPNPKTYGPVGNPTSGGADNTTVSQAGTGTDGQDDADIADVSLSFTNAYDLALAATVDRPLAAYNEVVTFSVTVQNQGILSARQFTVTDHVPDGLTLVNIGTAVNNGDGTISWTMSDLAPGASITRTFTAIVADFTKRPFRNVAEVSADSASTYSSAGETVTDRDSTPDTNIANDGNYGPVLAGRPIDNVDVGATPAINAAGVGADSPGSGGQDDADVADVDALVVYDLALVKTGPGVVNSTYEATFTITVANQGSVPSGPYSVTDKVPAGMTATGASNGGSLATPTTAVTWTGLPSIAPGATATLTVTLRVSDWSKRPFANFAEITADSAASYSTTDVTVGDIDSTPGDVATTGVDNTTIAEAGVGADAGFDDEDVAALVPDVVYDLALMKTVAAPTTLWNGQPVFTISVQNQGNVPSLGFTVTDRLPEGLSFVSATAGGTFTPGPVGGTGSVVWQLPSLAAGATTSVQLILAVSDVTKRPFVNRAEITSDSASQYSSPGGPVADVDSVPADVATSAADTIVMTQAGVDGDAGFDDEDIAAIDVSIRYDLSLVKLVRTTGSLAKGSIVGYDVRVTNEGNVPSGTYSVEDLLPAGMEYVSSSDGGEAAGMVITWTNLPSLMPGETKVLALDARLVDVKQPSYVNRAAVTKDGSSLYSGTTVEVRDVDSTPSKIDPGLPLPEIDTASFVALPVRQVQADNNTLPSTGSDTGSALSAAVAGIATGVMLLLIGRRRRTQS